MPEQTSSQPMDLSRRDVVALGLGATALVALPALPSAAQSSNSTSIERTADMGFVRTKDGVEIFYKDWGPKTAQPIAFHHGWPLSSDDWDAQLLYFVEKGYRVVAHDRRGHGRSAQVGDGHDMDHYVADAFAVYEHLDLRNP